MGREARANHATRETEIEPFVLTVPIAKRDDAKRLVSGIATAEVPDKQGEIVDYEVAKKFFTNPELWPGNIREMHQPKAVGKAVEVECDDANKTISITARISKGAEDTWQKVNDGTLSMFSIGGSGKRVVEKTADNKVLKRVMLEGLHEVSLVDNGANPAAKFEIVKSVDGVLTDAQPADEDPVAKVTEQLDAALEVTKKGDDKKGDDKNKTASGKEGKWYAGTDGKSFPIAEPEDVHNAAQALGRTKQDRAKVKANIIRIAYEAGASYVAQLPEAWKKKEDQKAEKLATPVRRIAVIGAGLGSLVTKFLGADRAADVDAVVKAGMEPWDIDAALALISGLERLMAGEWWDARMAAAQDGNSDGPEVAQVKLLKQAAQLVMQFLMSEWDEQFSAPDTSGGVPMPVPYLDLDDDVEMFAKALDVVVKAGARHSKSDVEMIQKVHDLSMQLGADCAPDQDTGYGESAKKAVAADPTKFIAFIGDERVTQVLKDAGYQVPGTAVLEPPADVQKISERLEAMTTELDTLKATVSAKDETIASQETRLKALEAQPMPGGPKRSAAAVDKSLGGPDDQPAADDDQPATLVKALEHIAKESGNETVKAAAAVEVLKLRRATGQDRIAPVSSAS